MELRPLLTTVPNHVGDTGLLMLRLGVGAVFVAHGYGDVFDAGIAANIGNYRDAGIPLPEVSAPFTAVGQLVGGALIMLGLLTRLWAASLVIVMVGAVVFVHWGEPLVFQPDGSGSGFAFIMGVASLALLLLGPGRFSVDALLTGAQSPARKTAGVRSPRGQTQSS